MHKILPHLNRGVIYCSTYTIVIMQNRSSANVKVQNLSADTHFCWLTWKTICWILVTACNILLVVLTVLIFLKEINTWIEQWPRVAGQWAAAAYLIMQEVVFSESLGISKCQLHGETATKPCRKKMHFDYHKGKTLCFKIPIPILAPIPKGRHDQVKVTHRNVNITMLCLNVNITMLCLNTKELGNHSQN